MKFFTPLVCGVLMAFTVVAPHYALAAGTIILFDKNDNNCTLPMPPSSNGAVWQYELAADKSPCKNNTARSIAFSGLPSSTKILLTDSGLCSKELKSTDSKFWIELLTTRKSTFMEIKAIQNFNTYTIGRIVEPGVQLTGMDFLGNAENMRDTLSCVQIHVSRGLTDPVAVTITPGSWSAGQPEENSNFSCTDNQILIGRKHYGDEEKATFYKCAQVTQAGAAIKLDGREWSEPIRESDSSYSCPSGKAMVGRRHSLDENGYTRYECAAVKTSADQEISILPDDKMSNRLDESGHTFNCAENSVLINRNHEDDENGSTFYRCATLSPTAP